VVPINWQASDDTVIVAEAVDGSGDLAVVGGCVQLTPSVAALFSSGDPPSTGCGPGVGVVGQREHAGSGDGAKRRGYVASKRTRFSHRNSRHNVTVAGATAKWVQVDISPGGMNGKDVSVRPVTIA